MREISWVAPPYVASKLGQQLSTGADDGDGGTDGNDQTTGPGLHGTGLERAPLRQRHAAPSASNRLTYVKGQAFQVSFTNQGDNDEFNIKVTLKIALAGGGSPITLNKTVPQVAKGEKATVELPLNRSRRSAPRSTISVTVAAVPGEKKTDNNKSTYPTLFDQGSSLSGVSEFSDAPGIVALAAAGAALIALIWLLVLSFRFRRVRSAQKAVLGEHGQTDLVAHASDLQHAFEALHTRVEDVAARLDERMAAAEDRLDGAIAYRVAGALRRLQRDVRSPVDDDRAARRRSQWRRALLDRPPRHRPPVLQAGPRRAGRAPALARGRGGDPPRTRRRRGRVRDPGAS